jgi:Outer membrane receptor proteins, mostly Fe transport
MSRVLGGSVAVLPFAFGMTSMAYAQASTPDQAVVDTPAEKPAAGEIVVTAQRREQRLQDVAASVVAFGGDDLARRSVTSISQVINLAPAVQVATPYGDGGPPNYTIRGISSTDASHNQSKPIAIYIDEGIRNFQVFEMMPVFDVERVEVLSGPQGTLYGKNATGGAVNIISKAPGFSSEGYLTIGYGNFNTRTARGAVQTPLVDDVLAARVAFTYTKDKGVIDQLTPGLKNTGQTDIFAVRGSLLFEPAPDFDATLRVYHVKSGGRNSTIFTGTVDPDFIPPSLLTVPGALRTDVGFYESATDTTPHRDIESTGVNLLMRWKPSDSYQVTSVTTYDDGHWYDTLDGDGLPIDLYWIDLRSKARQFVQELRINSDYAGPFNWQGGVYYGDDRVRFAQRLDFFRDARCGADCDFGITPGGTGQNTIDQFIQRRNSISAYLRGEFEVIEGFTISGGVRQSRDKLKVDEYSAYFGDTAEPLSIPIFENESRNATFNNTSFEAGIEWQAKPDILLYGTFKQGYRTGAVNGSALTDPSEVTIAPPEKAESFEIGAKTTFLDRRVTFNLAAFTMNYSNQQIQASELVGGIQTFPLRSIDKSRIRGVEAYLAVRPIDQLTLSVAASAIDPKYTKGTVAGIPVDGNQIINSAKYKLTFNGDAELLNTNAGTLDLNANASYSSRTYYDVYNTENISQGSYWLVNGKLGFNTPSWSIALYGKNLLNTKYIAYGLSLEDALGFNFQMRGVPRQYGGEFTLRF